MNNEMSLFTQKQKLNKKYKKYNSKGVSNNKYPNKKNKKIIYCIKRSKDSTNHLITEKNKDSQNSVIAKYDIEKVNNIFNSLKNSFNNNNSLENSKLFNHIKESKENIPINVLRKGILSTKSKKSNSSLKKCINKNDLYYNNSYLKNINLKSFQQTDTSYNNRLNLAQPLVNLGNKNRTVFKHLSNSNNKYLNNELKINKKIQSFGLLPFEFNKNPLYKNSNKNSDKCRDYSNKFIHNYYTQKNISLSNNLLYSNNFNLRDSRNISDFNEYNTFNYNEEKQVELTKEEKILYGDRVMKGYSKIKLLGKGGYGIVWLCIKNLNQNENENDNNIKYYAIKQTSKKKNQESSHNLNNILSNARNEISVLNILNNINKLNYSNDEYKENYCELIPKIYDAYEDSNDIWFSFEKGGTSLSNICFKIKGEFEKGERIYLIQKGQFLEYLFSNISQFKYLLKQLVIGINYINSKGIIHSDIKPENILIDFSQKTGNFTINSIKIIDYGSSFRYNEISSSNTSNTPEYLCPEITIGNKKFMNDLSNNNKYINAVDIWSLGITFLELCLCCPIWLNFKTKIAIKGKILYTHGIFGCKMRDASKIHQKQVEISKNLKKLLNNSLLYMFEKEDRDNFIDLLGKMLNIDYTKRINAKSILNHPFFGESNE